jgi:transketolase
MSDPHRTANVLRALAIDAVEAAKSGHPGMPLGTADMATAIFTKFLKHDPADPSWPDRDRFVLSAGHGSALLYSLLHLCGYEVTLDDLKAFRQWGSKTPGHPEYGHTAGVETTTGPLGQGFANGVGMAIAERFLRERFGRSVVDHRVFAIVSDGDLMEGVASEAASIAGHLGLGRLVYLYDSNAITIDGDTALSFSEDVGARFRSYGWHVLSCDGHAPDALEAAISEAVAVEDRPSLVICRTTIGFASSKAGSEKSHGAPLGPDDVAATKGRLGLDPTRHFDAPDDVKAAFRAHDGARRRAEWRARLDAHPEKDELLRWLARDGAALAETVAWPEYADGVAPATRKVSEACLKAVVAAAPWVLGGSADLAESNGVHLGIKGLSSRSFAAPATMHFGIREHAMGSIANGMVLHGGVLPYVATFLVFHDYMRPAVRLAALMKQPVVYVYSHDSVFLGEDGPTHQPVETLLALRSIPNVHVYRPGDARETVAAWKAALSRHDGPTALIVTRQGLPTLPGTAGREEAAFYGAYTVRDVAEPRVVLVATGSELAVAVGAADLLDADGVPTRVVSAPRREVLYEDKDLRRQLLPDGVPVVVVEAGLGLGWERYVGDATFVTIETFGASAKASDLAKNFGFTPEAVAARARQALR